MLGPITGTHCARDPKGYNTRVYLNPLCGYLIGLWFEPPFCSSFYRFRLRLIYLGEACGLYFSLRVEENNLISAISWRDPDKKTRYSQVLVLPRAAGWDGISSNCCPLNNISWSTIRRHHTTGIEIVVFWGVLLDLFFTCSPLSERFIFNNISRENTLTGPTVFLFEVHKTASSASTHIQSDWYTTHIISRKNCTYPCQFF